MNNLSQELVDKVFEYLPLKEIVLFSRLNDRTAAAALRQIKKRCTNFTLSAIHTLRYSSIKCIFELIGPHVRRMHVDLIDEKSWVPFVIESCQNLEILIYTQRVDNVCHNDLSSLKALQFGQVYCSEDMISSFMHKRCPNLDSLAVNHSDFTGSCLAEAPVNLRSLEFTGTKLMFQYIIDYIKVNPKLQDLCIQLEEDTTDMPLLVDNMQDVESLGLFGKQVITDGFQHLARLPKLTKLDIQISSENFYKYADAVDATHQLQELNISLDEFVVTYKFVECFEKFPNLTKLTICIGVAVENAKLMLRYLNYLGKYGTLETLVLAGHTEYLELDATNYQLRHIKELRICNQIVCTCKDHISISYYGYDEEDGE